jgi:hypothetical protein
MGLRAPHAGSPMSSQDKQRDLELERIVSMQEAQRLSTLSVDTLKRRYPNKIIQLSRRRQGMRLRDALLLGEDG